MQLRFHTMLLGILLAACHSTHPSGDAASYDSTTVTPAGKDSQSVKAPADVDSLEVLIRAPDSVFEDGSRPTTWKRAGFHDPVRFKRFIIRFKDWVKDDEVDSIVEHVRFPIHAAGSPAWFKEQYAEIFTPSLKGIVARQRLDRIFRNGQGAMIGNGDVWFVEWRGKYWITAVN
jgi:hypothetical protein